MELWLDFICCYAHEAYWVFFILLMLAGLNVPISEDVILLTGGFLASKYVPDNKLLLYISLYLGCWLSAWECYWIGRLLGPKLYNFKWFNYFITKEKINSLHRYYEDFGVWTFVIGRFIPGGVRNALFISSGMGNMSFKTFILRDAIACFFSSLTIFFLGYTFAENYDAVVSAFQTYSRFVFAFILIGAVSFFIWKRYINVVKANRPIA